MRPNAMRSGLARGELQIGTWVTMARNPASLTLLQAAGLDFARIDMEHSATTIETIADFAVLDSHWAKLVRPGAYFHAQL